MIRRVAVGIVAAAAIGTGAGAIVASTGAAHTPAVCYEDMPCWQCEDMGNRVCGPDAPEWMRGD